MIRQLKGVVTFAEQPIYIIDVNGVGYEVLSSTLDKPVGAEVISSIFTVVREDSLTLYGFKDEQERGLFALLLSVNGVGPKSALTILGSITVNEISQALAKSNPEPFTQIKGIGKKVAERIVLDLTGSLDKQAQSEDALAVASALENLGFKQREYRDLLKKLPAKSLPEQITWALQEIGR